MSKSLAHTKWMCKYHIIFTPKYRRKVIYNQYKASIVEILKFEIQVRKSAFLVARVLCEYCGTK